MTADGPSDDSRHTIALDTAPSADDIEVLREGLRQHAAPFVSVPGFHQIAVFLRDERGRIRGGVAARINWNWLDVFLVWVDEALRTEGWGRRLMEAIEAVAIERGCTEAHLDTFSYQARPFYERLGYHVFAQLDDYPIGHQRFYLRKRLSPPR